jgi:Fe-S-cluster containining protein
MCCLLLKIKETDSKPCVYCKHCEPNVGCKIYKNRPEACRIFECAWKQMEHSHIDLRPDKCGVLFEKWSDKVIVGSMNISYISDLIEKQIDYFRSENISVIMINHFEKYRTYFLAQGHTKEFVQEEINNSIKNVGE